MIWFTSDTHFNHTRVIEYCKRPFSSVEEMNSVIIDNWNKVVKPSDTVYHLGDFAFGSKRVVAPIVEKLKGNKIICYGDHDKSAWLVRDMFGSCHHVLELKIDNHVIWLSHYPHLRWRKSHYGSYHLHGHCHGSLKIDKDIKRVDVGVDVHNFTPVCFDQILALFK